MYGRYLWNANVQLSVMIKPYKMFTKLTNGSNRIIMNSKMCLSIKVDHNSYIKKFDVKSLEDSGVYERPVPIVFISGEGLHNDM